MASTNKKISYGSVKTYEGGTASRISNLEALKRSVLSTLLWEDSFYEEGEEIGKRIFRLTKTVGKENAISVLLDAKEKQKLRHTPLLMLVSMIEEGWADKHLINRIITRVDDMMELLSLYWMEGKKPVDKQLKKGLDLAFRKFDEYSLQKYNRAKEIKLRDVLRIVRPKPISAEQSDLWGRVVKNALETPKTWETMLSAGKGKKKSFEELLDTNMLGDLAFLRNLRGMEEAGVDRVKVKESFQKRNWKYIIPFQFITASQHAPRFEPELEEAMFSCLKNVEKMPQSASLLVDVSGSMQQLISAKSEVRRQTVAVSLAMIARELIPEMNIYTFAGSCSFVPARHGFALRDAIGNFNGGSTEMWGAIRYVAKTEGKKDLMIVITDEQTQDTGHFSDANASLLVIINIGPHEKGVAYEKGVLHINGWSEHVLEYLREYIAQNWAGKETSDQV